MIDGDAATMWSCDGARPKEWQTALGAARLGQHLVERTAGAGECSTEHPPGGAIERPKAWHAGRRSRCGGKEDRIEYGARPGKPVVEHGGMRQRVDAVQQDEVVAGEDLTQAAVVRGPIGQVEVAKHGNLPHRALRGRVGGCGLDPLGIGMRAGELDADPWPRHGRSVHGPGDCGHGMPAIDEGTGQNREGANIARGADRGQRDLHQMVAMRRGAMRGP